MLGDLDASNFAADALKLRKQIQALQFPRHPEACIAGNASSSNPVGEDVYLCMTLGGEASSGNDDSEDYVHEETWD